MINLGLLLPDAAIIGRSQIIGTLRGSWVAVEGSVRIGSKGIWEERSKAVRARLEIVSLAPHCQLRRATGRVQVGSGFGSGFWTWLRIRPEPNPTAGFRVQLDQANSYVLKDLHLMLCLALALLISLPPCVTTMCYPHPLCI